MEVSAFSECFLLLHLLFLLTVQFTANARARQDCSTNASVCDTKSATFATCPTTTGADKECDCMTGYIAKPKGALCRKSCLFFLFLLSTNKLALTIRPYFLK